MKPEAAASDGAGCKHLWCPPGLSSNTNQPLIHSEASAKWRRRFRNADVERAKSHAERVQKDSLCHNLSLGTPNSVVCGPFLYAAAVFFAVLIQHPQSLISSPLSSCPLPSFRSLSARLSLSLRLSNMKHSPTLALPHRSIALLVPNPRLFLRHSFSLSYLLHTQSILTSATAEARMLP